MFIITIVFEVLIRILAIKAVHLQLILYTPYIKHIGNEVADVKSSCKPFNALFIWHTGSGEYYSILQHQRLLFMLIKDFPENTSVSVVTIGAKTVMRLHFRKQEGYDSWIASILRHKPGISLNHEVTYADIQKALSYHESNSNEAQLVYLLVNSRTVIRDEENNFEELRKKKTFVFLSEIQTAETEQNWLKLAVNDQHFVALDSKVDDVNITKQIILARSCQDSMFVCDTDMYWSRERSRCDACTNICSSGCKVQPEYCFQACPFFHQPEALQKYTGTVVYDNSGLTYINVIILLVVVAVLFSFVAYQKRRSLFKCKNSVCRWMATPQENLPYYMKSKQTNKTKDLYDKTVSKDETVNLLDKYSNPTDNNDFEGISDMELKVLS